MTNRYFNLFACGILLVAGLALLDLNQPLQAQETGSQAVDKAGEDPAKKAADEARVRLNGRAMVHLCYRLASSNVDDNRPAGYAGIPYADVDGKNAADACARAVAFRPGEAGLQVSYGRALDAAKRYDEAVVWYRKSADQGYALAQNNLAMKYTFGEGVAQDYAKAAKWYHLAADQGNAIAQRNLGELYYKGQGVEQDYVKAAHWYNMVGAKSP
jgi:TPR repeat protein